MQLISISLFTTDKKQGLDQEILKKYRPVSNLTFVWEILEKVILEQLEMHLASRDLMDVLCLLIVRSTQQKQIF